MEAIEVHKKNGFSERKGLKKFSSIVQTDSLNTRTRNKIYNSLKDTIEEIAYDDRSYSYDLNTLNKFIEYIYNEVFSLTYDDIPLYNSQYDYSRIYYDFKRIILDYSYSDIFDFIEAIICGLKHSESGDFYKYGKYSNKFVLRINEVFKEERVNYTIIDNLITDIVSDIAIESIEDTLNNENMVTSNHLSKALKLLYKDKDYDNSIKESITAVESKCQILTKNKIRVSINMKKGTLDDPMNIAEDISEKGHWGNGDYRVDICNENDIDNIMPLIKQSLKVNKK